MQRKSKPKKTWTTQEREMLFRRNNGKIGREAYLQKLGAFFATPVQAGRFLSLEETDAIVKKERAILQEQQWISINSTDRNALYPISTRRSDVLALYPGWGYMDTAQILAFMQHLLDQQCCYLYWYNDSYCGGMYQTGSGAQLNLNYDFAQHKPDGIWLYAADECFRFHLDYVHDEVLYPRPDRVLYAC